MVKRGFSSRSVTETAWRDVVQADYGVSFPNTVGALCSGPMGSVCAIPARATVGGHTLPRKVLCEYYSNLRSTARSLLLVSVPETVDCVDSSRVEGPVYCSNYCQSAGKSSRGRGIGVQASRHTFSGLLALIKGLVWAKVPLKRAIPGLFWAFRSECCYYYMAECFVWVSPSLIAAMVLV